MADELIAAVLNSEADAALVDRAFAQESVAASNGQLTVLATQVVLVSGIGAGVRDSDTDLKNKLDGAINAMKADGSLNDRIRKWFDEDAEVF